MMATNHFKTVCMVSILGLLFTACNTPTNIHNKNTPMAEPIPNTQTVGKLVTELPVNTQIITDVVYKSVNHRDLKLDIYLPAQFHANKPLVVWVHGGAWRRGNKSDFPTRNMNLAKTLLNQGYAIASIEYRLSGEAIFPAQIQDVNDAIHFLANHAEKYGWHADNIMLAGRSAGAHLSALASVPANTPDNFATTARPDTLKIKAAAVFFGLYDLIALGEQKNNPQGGSETALLGAAPKTIPDIARQASPLTHVSRNTPPMILLHGLADRTAPPAQSELLQKALKNANVDHEMYLIENAKHGDIIFDNDENVHRTVEFLNRYR